jgi:3-deoxy-D-manno-octulosonate 8-phosphate phosphatase KdsC-like HAD superfamily phosphatase
VADAPAGSGAAREVCEYVLDVQGKLAGALARYGA